MIRWLLKKIYLRNFASNEPGGIIYWHWFHDRLFHSSEKYFNGYNRAVEILEYKLVSQIPRRMKLFKKAQKQEILERAIKENDLKTIDKLHKADCPGCSWDGSTIFPKYFKDY